MKESKRMIKQIILACVIIVMCGYTSMTVFAETNENEYNLPISANDFNITGKWTYIDNTENNPVPVLIDQGSNTWILAIYQGTKVSLDINHTYGKYYAPYVVEKSDFVSIGGDNSEIEVNALQVGTDIVSIQLIDLEEEEEIVASATQVTLIVNVVPANPDTGNGIWTNKENNSKVPAYIVEQKFQQIATMIFNDSMSDYQKVKATWDWMIENITYDIGTLKKYRGEIVSEKERCGIAPHSSAGIIDGLVVCDGYTAIFNRFMRLAGIESREISGISYGDSHAWNQVKLGGQWYNIDVRDDEFFPASANYDYFLVGSHTLLYESESQTFYTQHKPNSGYIDEMEEAVADYPVDHKVLWRENNMKDPNYYYDAEEDSFILIEGSAVDNFYRYAVWDDELEDYVYDYSVDQEAIWWE